MSAAGLVRRLRERGETLAVCESLTGGAIGAEITGVAGASDVFVGGLITYATRLKVSLAGVGAQTIETCGVVSGETAAEMAAGVLRVCDATWGLAVTGVAGPDRTCGHAPGTVCLGIAREGFETLTAGLRFDGDRDAVRNATVVAAIEALIALLGPHPSDGAE